jgi:hypothetical protein
MAIINTVHTQYELGFSSPHATPEVEYSDMGFADPYDITITNPFGDGNTHIYKNKGNQGFGDPYGKTNLYIEGNKSKFSDDGGEIAIIRGKFSDLLPSTPDFQPIGPFQIDFISVSNPSQSYTAYSGVPQNKRLLWTTIHQDKMYVCLPVMPKGLYNLKLFYGNGFINTTTITAGIEIIHRSRFDKAIAIRHNLPGYLNRGNISDNVKPSQVYKTESNIAVMTSAVAESLDYAFPNSYTVTTQNIYKGDTTINVESTLRFPSSGSIFIDGFKISYTGKTNTTLTGVSGIIKTIQINSRATTKETGNYAEIPNFILRQHDDLAKPNWPLTGSNWEAAFNVMHYGERSAMSVNFEYFYQLFKPVTPKKLATYTLATKTLTFSDANTAKTVFNQKYCKIASKIYHIETASESNNTIKLTPFATSYWNEPDLSNASVYSVEILPFWIREDNNGKFSVEMESSIFAEDLGFIDKDHLDRNIYLGSYDIEDGTLLRHLAAGILGSVKRRNFYGDNWGITINQDIRSASLVISPARNLV